MVHALFQIDCTEICVGSACTQPSYNDKSLSSVFVLISLYVFPVSIAAQLHIIMENYVELIIIHALV